jgi:hypothetical protein
VDTKRNKIEVCYFTRGKDGKFVELHYFSQISTEVTLLVRSRTRGKARVYTTFKARETASIAPVNLTPLALEIDRPDLTNRVCPDEDYAGMVGFLNNRFCLSLA